MGYHDDDAGRIPYPAGTLNQASTLGRVGGGIDAADRVTSFAARINAIASRIDNATYGIRAVSNTLAGPAPEAESLRQAVPEPISAFDRVEEALEALLRSVQYLDEQTERLRSVVGI